MRIKDLIKKLQKFDENETIIFEAGEGKHKYKSYSCNICKGYDNAGNDIGIVIEV